MKKTALAIFAAIATASLAGSGAWAAGTGVRVIEAIDYQSPAQSRAMVQKVYLRPFGIRRSLRARGFYRIVFTDRTLPVYRVRACRNGKRFALRLNRWGDIMHRRRIGWCDDGPVIYPGPRAGLPLPVIRRILRARGYRRIRYVDRMLPVYKAVACKRARRFLLRINRFGGIMSRERVGWCYPPVRYYDNDDYYDGPRRRPHVIFHAPGISISLGKGQ